ncbi:AraC family transcriptional regulator [Consotaella salsifontis]|uniref:Transcriptional regulator, AraC family n=1 Tax=Consotaella salsifontis TaxID=1365950 RepID=A0A1T4LVA0_9HYPH|nr:AraC family transcriptional regulator [Consotaella salsifontis]SJZ58612.1 transcriptional regulator, AraC family [Consotaella salsifontis]
MHDPLSDVLAVLGTKSVRGTSLEAQGAWALSFDGRLRLKFVAVARGQCWLTLPDRAPELLSEGDVVLLSNTRYTVASDPALEAIDGMALYALPGQNTVRLGNGCDTVMIGGGSGFEEGCASFVLDALPRFLRISQRSPSAEAINRTLQSLHEEMRQEWAGAALIAERLADVLVVEAVRAYIATGATPSIGWIAALGDGKIAEALKLMHSDVARRWTVPDLAREVGMSRSALTQRFSQKVGRPPLDYLTLWRMLLAQRKLAGGEAIATVAEDVGYQSQSAFAHAFKRRMGRTPRQGAR